MRIALLGLAVVSIAACSKSKKPAPTPAPSASASPSASAPASPPPSSSPAPAGAPCTDEKLVLGTDDRGGGESYEVSCQDGVLQLHSDLMKGDLEEAHAGPLDAATWQKLWTAFDALDFKALQAGCGGPDQASWRVSGTKAGAERKAGCDGESPPALEPLWTLMKSASAALPKAP